MAQHDLVIRNGLLVDGTGAGRRHGSVAIKDGMITAVADAGTDDENEIGSGHQEIDADGRLVTPGWVDMHTHYDAQATWDPHLTPSGWHGVTTVVMGNCGVGFAPAASDRHDWLIELMEGVEDIPGAAMHEGIEWEWETFPEYLDALSRRNWVADIGTQVPHGALRAFVMGERGAANEDATVDDIAEMARLTGEGLRAGALGFSTSRTPLHKSIHGELVPGTYADIDELMGIADAIAEVGHGVFQGAFHHTDVPDSFSWFKEITRRTGKPLTFNFVQTDAAPDLWRDVLGMLDEARAEGLRVTGQSTGRPIGVLQSWLGTVHPFLGCPTWRRELADLPDDELIRRLGTSEVRSALTTEAPEGLTRFQEFVFRSWDKMWPFAGEADYEPAPKHSVANRAKESGRDPIEIAYDQLMSNGGHGVLYFPLFNYSEHTLDPLFEIHQNPSVRMGLADSGAHCATICDGGMPSFMLSYWSRDRSRGERLPLELVVKRQTSETAQHYDLHDRGVLAPGYRADINVIDYDALNVEAPHMVGDFPTGAKRYVQKAVGYSATVCAGQIVSQDGEFTDALPGKLLRGPQHK